MTDSPMNDYKQALDTHIAQAVRLSKEDGWHKARLSGYVTFGDLEEGQYFLDLGRDNKPIILDNGYGKQTKYHASTTLGDNKRVNYCIERDTLNDNDRVSWQWAQPEKPVYGLIAVEEY